MKSKLANVTIAKTSTPKGKEKVAAQVFEQQPHKGKEGLGYVAPAKKKVKQDQAYLGEDLYSQR